MAISLDGNLVNQIDDALDTTEALKNDEGMYKAPRAAFETFFTKALAAILRVTGEKSVYTEGRDTHLICEIRKDEPI